MKLIFIKLLYLQIKRCTVQMHICSAIILKPLFYDRFKIEARLISKQFSSNQCVHEPFSLMWKA